MTHDDLKPNPHAADMGDARALAAAIQISLIGLGLGLAFEVLVYRHPLGISFPIWVGLSVTGLVAAAVVESFPVSVRNVWLAAPILFMASMTALRLEPLTTLLNVVMTLALLALWVHSFRAGNIRDYGWLDFGLAIGWVPIESLVRPWPTLGIVQKWLIDDGGRRSRLFAVLRGVILAIPILAVFLVLLSAADLVFGEYVELALRWFDLARLADWAGRALIILFAAVFSLGAIVAALRAAADRRLIADRGPLIKPFLGFTEVLIVLGSVDVVFALFVIVQIAYFFGGEANVTAAGFTYSEYARRGFGELVAVGVLSLGLIMTLAAVARRESRRQRATFNALSASLVIMVGVILASALKRLLLYEQAYGFTRLRTYTHVAIVWMAVVFGAFLLLLLRDSLRRFAPVCAAAVVGFAATFNLLNVDAFIVDRNVTRVELVGELDVEYLVSLSEDAVPGIVALAVTGSEETRAALLPELACWEGQLETRQNMLGWQSTHLGRVSAAQAFSRIAPLLSGIAIEEVSGVWWVGEGSGRHMCLRQPWGFRVD